MSIQSNFPNLKPSLLLDFANTKQLDNRITFTRSTPAVYYDGKTTAMAEQNLVTYSQDFTNNVWYKREVSISANSTTAPDGTLTADTITPTTVNDYHYIYLQSTPTNCVNACFSVYAKANGYNNLFIRSNTNTSYQGVNFNLSTGAINATEGSVTGTITSVGNGWYRCSVNYFGLTLASQTQILINPDTTNSPSVWTANGTSGVYLWGAQIETNRSLPTAYTPTTSQAITNYIPVLLTAGGNQARFDCNPTTGESLGLLIEEQRTNLLVYSAQFDNANWSKDGGISVIANQAVAPDGTVSADQMNRVAGSLTNWGQLTQIVSVGTGGNVGKTYTFSVWVQALPTSGSVSGSIAISDVNYGTFSQAFTATSTPTRIKITTSGGAGWNASGQYIGGGITLNSNDTSVLVWGAQLEVGAFATSYIATTSASATRTADSAVMTGANFSSWYNQAQGTIYAEGQINYNPIGGGSNAFYSIDDTSASTNVIQPYFSASSGILFSFVNVNGSEQANTGVTPISASTFFKHAQIYQANNFASVVNNLTVSTDSSGVTPVVTQLQFANAKSKYFRKFAYYPLVVTSSQLQALTS